MSGDPMVSVACEAGALLGEGPVWDTARQCLWFTDIKSRLLHRFDPDTGAHRSWEAPAEIGWALPAEDGSLIAGILHDLYRFDPDSGAFSHLASVPGEPAHNRLNDACTDPIGRIWFGSMDDAERASTGRFYCFDRGTIRPAGPDGICITNGPAISRDGSRIYFVDTLAKRVFVAAVDKDGGVGDTRLFFDIADPYGFADGPIIDAEDHIWIGLYGGRAIERYDPDGRHVDRIDLPVSNCTKGAFGGADLDRLYLTTARQGLLSDALLQEPHAGHLLCVDPGVHGLPTTPVRLG